MAFAMVTMDDDDTFSFLEDSDLHTASNTNLPLPSLWDLEEDDFFEDVDKLIPKTTDQVLWNAPMEILEQSDGVLLDSLLAEAEGVDFQHQAANSSLTLVGQDFGGHKICPHPKSKPKMVKPKKKNSWTNLPLPSLWDLEEDEFFEDIDKFIPKTTDQVRWNVPMEILEKNDGVLLDTLLAEAEGVEFQHQWGNSSLTLVGQDFGGHKICPHPKSKQKMEKPKKKNNSWTKEEHERFLIGLREYKKGDWKSISRLVVLTKTPTQVASHAQKFYLRQTDAKGRKRRSSIFDIITTNKDLVATFTTTDKDLVAEIINRNMNSPLLGNPVQKY